MLAPSEALVKARTYLGEVIPEFAALNPKVDEMVLAPDSSAWQITFYAQNAVNKKPETIAEMFGDSKISKVVNLRAEDGTLIAVRNPYF